MTLFDYERLNLKNKAKYDPQIEEKQIFELWQKESLYSLDEHSTKEIFIIDTPPPYTNASWHMGGAIHYSMIDMIGRTMRMKGYNVLFPMGLDRNGLPIEIQTEKEFDLNLNEISREEFLEKCSTLLNKYGSQILNLTKKLGLSCNSFDWDKIYRTDDPKYRSLTQETFIKLWKQGNLIYESDRPNNWDIKLQTTISDAEIEYKEQMHTLYDIEFCIENSNDRIIISTTRPELIPAIGLITYNPNDDRYAHLENQNAISPIWNKKIPIKHHPYARADFGSGIMMICSYGDRNDIKIYQELGLKPSYAINKYGKMTKLCGKYEGLSIKKARKEIITDLLSQGLIKAEKEIKYMQPTSERSGSNIEFISMPEYYLKQIFYTQNLKDLAHGIKFYPKESRKIWENWLDSISIDWPISRRRYYGTEIPLWYCNSCDYTHCPEPGPYYQPWKNPPPIESCPNCGGKSFTGETRIFDTWMDSSISAYYITKYSLNINESNLKEYLREKGTMADLRPQGKDIIRTWLHYSMLRGLQLFNKPMFSNIWISGHVMDHKGEKMSKSKGNIIRPEKIISRYGADALRLFGACETSIGSDIKFNESKLKGNAKFLNKLFNIAKFITQYSFPNSFREEDLYPTDKWILNFLFKTINQSLKGYQEFDFSIPANTMKNFTKDIFSNHYIEMIKHRFHERNQFSNIHFSLEINSASYTLYTSMRLILLYLSPIIPFITDFIFRNLFNKSIHKELWHTRFQIFNDIDDSFNEKILTFNQEIWKRKKTLGIKLRESINIDYFPKDLELFRSDLIAMHNIIETNPDLLS